LERLLGAGQALIMSRLAGLLVLLLSGSLPTLACINTFETEIKQYLLNNDELGLKAIMYDLESKYQKDPSLEHTNDLAVARLLTRRYPEAIQLLKEADSRFNGSAIVAANLGTALELSGNDVEALHWIREGVRRDPNEHEGSEWLHVKILEAKVALAADPEWLKKNTVLGVNFGEGDLPVMPASLPIDEKGVARTPAQVASSIDYQLRERTKFVEPPDAVVADLYAALGDLAYAVGKPAKYEGALPEPTYSYDEALTYGPVHRERVEKRKQLFDAAYANVSWFPPVQSAAGSSTSENEWRTYGMLVLILLAIAGVFIAALRRFRKP